MTDIEKVQKLLGEDPTKRCRHCGVQPLLGHSAECMLRRVRPDVIIKGMKEAATVRRKNMNRQRIFKTDKPRWNGLPPFQKTLVRRRGASKNRGPNRKMQWCQVCGKAVIFLYGKCRICEHERPCAYDPNGPNCNTCH